MQATPTPLKGKDAETQESARATPILLKAKDASYEESVEGLEPKAQPSMAAAATEEDTSRKVLIHAELRKMPDSYPKDASG